MKPQSVLDKWIMRTKDFFLIGGFIVTGMLFFSKHYNLPAQVEANAAEIEVIKSKSDARFSALDIRLSRMEVGQDYANKNTDDIKTWVKSISARIH